MEQRLSRLEVRLPAGGPRDAADESLYMTSVASVAELGQPTFTAAALVRHARFNPELASLAFDTADQVADLVAEWDAGRHDEFEIYLYKIMIGFKSKSWHPGRHTGQHLDLVLDLAAGSLRLMVDGITSYYANLAAYHDRCLSAGTPDGGVV